jgi:hypothetical protein
VHGRPNALTLALASPVKLDAASEHDFPDSSQISESKAAAFLDALKARNFMVAAISRTASSAPAILPSTPPGDADDEMISTNEVKGIMEQLKVFWT